MGRMTPGVRLWSRPHGWVAVAAGDWAHSGDLMADGLRSKGGADVLSFGAAVMVLSCVRLVDGEGQGEARGHSRDSGWDRAR